MSADANSAFGDALGKRARARRYDDREDRSSFLPQPFSDNLIASGQPLETTPRSSVLPTSANAQAASMPVRMEWFDASTVAPSALEEWIQKLQAQFNKTFADQVTPVRLAGHISVLLVATVILVLNKVDLPTWDFSLRAFPNSALLGTSDSVDASLSAQIAGLVQGGLPVNESLQRAAVPFTTVQEKPTPEVAQIQLYTIQGGDTVLGIAEKFGLNPETIQWSNPTLETNADLIRPGDEIKILPVNGVLHTVTSGDTLLSLSEKYKVTVEDIVNYAGNGLVDDQAKLSIAAQLVIPNGTKPYATAEAVAYTSSGAVPASAKIGAGTFVWPVVGSIYQRFWGGHAAIDVGGWTGAPVKAADGGYVVVAAGGWNGGYGNHIIVDHGNGFVTLYAHLNSIYVKPGESVAAGAVIGGVGNTGNSTGPHLHFELRYQGVPRNPLNYLP